MKGDSSNATYLVYDVNDFIGILKKINKVDYAYILAFDKKKKIRLWYSRYPYKIVTWFSLIDGIWHEADDITEYFGYFLE